MPLHDWSRIPAGLFHDFHQTWSIQIKLALNAGILPRCLSALVEQRSGPRESDVLAIESLGRQRSEFGHDGGVATLAPPATRLVGRSTKQIYATRANRVVVKHRLGRTIAVIEIVSPGNVEPIGVGDILPAMPLFLGNGWQVPVPLEATYLTTWNTSPEDFRVAVATGVMPELDVE
jgi:hypothetical protein